MSTATAPPPSATNIEADKLKAQTQGDNKAKGPIVSLKKEVKKKPKTAVDELTAEEREAVTIVFHQFETGLREGTIFTKVKLDKILHSKRQVLEFYWNFQNDI